MVNCGVCPDRMSRGANPSSSGLPPLQRLVEEVVDSHEAIESVRVVQTNNAHHKLKNDLMMRILSEFDEWNAFRIQLEIARLNRKRGYQVEFPKYPTALQERVEEEVDRLIRNTVDRTYKGTWIDVHSTQ